MIGLESVDKMDSRELVRGLMRGDRASQKLGYSAENAVRAVESVQGALPGDIRDRLLAYAEGFADGLREDSNRTYPTLWEED